MLPVLMAAGRFLMGGGSRAAAAAKNLVGAGPRGANEVLEGGAKAAGKSSPLDMLGNVANIAGVGMQGFEMFGGGDKKPAAGPSGGSHYESVLD